MTISNEQLDELLKGCARPEDLLGEAGLMKELNLQLMERMAGREQTAHLGYEAGAEPPSGQANRAMAARQSGCPMQLSRIPHTPHPPPSGPPHWPARRAGPPPARRPMRPSWPLRRC